MIRENIFLIEKIDDIVFLGHSEILDKFIETNKKLKINSHIVTSPDQKKKFKNVKFKNDIRVFKKLDSEFKNFVKKNFDIKKTLFISLSSRWIFKKDTINFLKNNLINMHPSRLPFDRGGATFSWQIMKGNRIHASTAHIVDEGVDTGGILFTRETLYPYKCKTPLDFENYDRKMLLVFYDDLLKKIIKEKSIYLQQQNDKISNYNPRINSEKDSWIDWNLEPNDLVNFINAFDDPYEGAKTFLNGEIVRLKSVQLNSAECGSHPFMIGIVIRKNEKWLVINIANNKTLLVEKILSYKNKDVINKVKLGDRFFSGEKELSKAKSIRSRFSSIGLKK